MLWINIVRIFVNLRIVYKCMCFYWVCVYVCVMLRMQIIK